jgi:hypothetical protein
MRKKKTNPHRGSSLDEFLEEEGILEEATAKAAKKALAWQFAQAMKEQNITKTALARRMKTSRAQLDRLLDPESSDRALGRLTRRSEATGYGRGDPASEPPHSPTETIRRIGATRRASRASLVHLRRRPSAKPREQAGISALRGAKGAESLQPRTTWRRGWDSNLR